VAVEQSAAVRVRPPRRGAGDPRGGGGRHHRRRAAAAGARALRRGCVFGDAAPGGFGDFAAAAADRPLFDGAVAARLPTGRSLTARWRRDCGGGECGGSGGGGMCGASVSAGGEVGLLAGSGGASGGGAGVAAAAGGW